MTNYERINGVSYSRFVVDEKEPRTDQHDATVEEMYFDNGKLIIRATTDDGHIDLAIPILPVDRWDGFVESLPTWQ